MKTNLRKYRFERGDLSQQQLAGIIKVSLQTIVAIERGDYSLPQDTYIQGHLCKGEGPRSWHTCFYPDGKLEKTSYTNIREIRCGHL